MNRANLAVLIIMSYVFLISLIVINRQEINHLKKEYGLSNNIAQAEMNSNIYQEPSSLIGSSSDRGEKNKYLSMKTTDKNSTEVKVYNIGDLMVLDKLFDESNSTSGNDSNSLGEILIMNAIFNEHEFNSPDNRYRLGDLFTLNTLFNSGKNKLFESNFTSLGDLMVLDQLFNN